MKSQSFAVTIFSTFVLSTGSLFTGSLALAQSGATSGSTPSGEAVDYPNITVFRVPSEASRIGDIDFVNPKPMEKTIQTLPGNSQEPQHSAVARKSGHKSGRTPNSSAPKIPTVKLPKPIVLSSPPGVKPNNFGTSNHPFTNARNPQITDYPYSPSGKLFFNIGSSTYVCSASVIQRGVVVTAAHCVANFGASQLYSNWQFVPAYDNGNAPYGVWTASTAFVPTSYLNGTDRCSVTGVVCDNDVALLVMTPQSSYNVGDYTGWYGFSYGGFGFTSFLNNTAAQLTEIGYPVSLDNGVIQQRNDSLAYTDNNGSYQEIIGSLMTGGSSGGPWLLNYGVNPTVYPPNTQGQSWTDAPTVTGVTSWGYTTSYIKEQGASVFTSSNILTLYDKACSDDASVCN